MAKLNNREKEWVEARQRYALSHALVQMARELEIIPRSLAKQADVPAYLQQLYLERFGRSEPATVVTIENRARQEQRDNALEKLAQKKLASQPKEPEARTKSRPHVSYPRPRG